MNQREIESAKYMYNLGKQSPKLSKKGKREFRKALKDRFYFKMLPNQNRMTHYWGENQKGIEVVKNKGKTGTVRKRKYKNIS